VKLSFLITLSLFVAPFCCRHHMNTSNLKRKNTLTLHGLLTYIFLIYTITNWRISLSKICHEWPNNAVTHKCVQLMGELQRYLFMSDILEFSELNKNDNFTVFMARNIAWVKLKTSLWNYRFYLTRKIL
jgi:hypothetical protein